MKINKILIIHTWGIGDLVMFTPALRTLRENLPGAIIDLLITHQPAVADALQENKTVNKVIRFYWKEKNVFEKAKLIWQLRKGQYDWAIVTSWTNPLKGGLLALLAGAKFRAGVYKEKKSPFYTHQVPGADKKPRRETNLDLMRVMGLKVNKIPQPFFELRNEDKYFAEKFITDFGAKDKVLIGFHPGAEKVHNYLLWDKDYFVELGKAIVDNYKNAMIIVFGGPEEKELCREIAEKIGKNVLTATGLSLKQAVALMNNCRIFVAGDSGLGHLATTTEADLILMFGPSEAELFAPKGPKIHLFSEKCRNLYDEKRVHTCLKRIKPETVFREIEKILGKPPV